MNNKYTISFLGKTTTIEVSVEYSDGGFLNRLAFPDDLSRDKIEWCYNRIPLDEADLKEYPGAWTIQAVPNDLSFPIFWEAYGHKIGDKTRSLKLWAALNDSDRIKCLRSIPQYNQWLKLRPSMERLYPETFLKQERFRNEFKV